MSNVVKKLHELRFNSWSFFTFLIAALVSIPVIVIFSYVFTPAGDVWRHLISTVLKGYIVNTLLLMIGVGAGSLVIGVGTAWLCTMYRFPGRRIFEWALLIPMAMPAYIIAYTYTGMLEFAGPLQTALRNFFGWGHLDYWFPDIRSLGGAIIIMSLVLYPYIYLLARAAFLEQSICVLEISRTMGRGQWRSFTDVGLPLARPAIIIGLSLVLMETISDYGTVEYFGLPVFTTGIFRTWFGLGDAAAAAQLAAVMMIFVLILIVLERWSRGKARYYHTSTRYRPLPGYRLRGIRAGIASTACLTPVLLGFLLPVSQLLLWSIQTAGEMIDISFLFLALNSFSVAAIAAILAVVIAIIMAYGLRLRRSPAMTFLVRIASLGYAVPGTVIALGVMLPFAWLDKSIDAYMRSFFGISTGLILSGTIFILLFAYMVRFIAVSFNTVEAGFAKVTPSISSAARTLGLSPGKALIRVDARIMKGSLLTAIVLVFVDVMKELPATLILRPFYFNTLAVRAFELASDERLADSASAALAIVLVGILPVLLLSIAIARSRPGYSSE